jgi:hypothetical protein
MRVENNRLRRALQVRAPISAIRRKAFKKGRKTENGDNSPSLADLASGGDAEDEMPVLLDIAAGNAARVLQRQGNPPALVGQPAS